jgi:hypothetical protein
MSQPAFAIVVASHRRSGTHLTIDLLRRQLLACQSWKWPGERLNRLYLNLETLTNGGHGREITTSVADRILTRAACPVIKTHQLPPLLSQNIRRTPRIEQVIANSSTVYLIRDGRAALCSLHLYMSRFDPKAREPLASFIRQEDEYGRSRVRQWRDHVEQWLNQPQILTVFFESLLERPEYEL